jgi:hypothetical protein
MEGLPLLRVCPSGVRIINSTVPARSSSPAPTPLELLSLRKAKFVQQVEMPVMPALLLNSLITPIAQYVRVASQIGPSRPAGAAGTRVETAI